jgi:large conductance mechanosensitive channel
MIALPMARERTRRRGWHMSSFVAGFKKFIAQGNAIDLAVGVIIGAAFSAIIAALLSGIITPLIAALFGKPNLDSVMNFEINKAHFSIGVVLTAILLFVLTALAIYLFIVIPINKMKARQAVDDEAPVREDIALLTEIRDLLQTRNPPA